MNAPRHESAVEIGTRIHKRIVWAHRLAVLRSCVPFLAFGLLCWLLGWVCAVGCIREGLR